VSNWRYVAASVIGSSHAEQGMPCQDRSIARIVEPDALLLVASDGAGSARLSDVGAHLACSTLLEEVTAYLQAGRSVTDVDERAVNAWLDAIIGRLRLQAKAEEAAVRDFACTLVAALLGKTESMFVQIGDGAIVTGQGSQYSSATWPVSGDYANTTYFLTDDRALDELQLLLHQPPVDEVALFTDGLQMLALQFSSRRPHDPFFFPMFSRLREEKPGESLVLEDLLRDYLTSNTICTRTDDDKTLVLATRYGGPPHDQSSAPSSPHVSAKGL
jgi:hypothetical protein